MLPQYLLILLESLKRRITDCGSSSQKGALDFGVTPRASLFPASVLNVVCMPCALVELWVNF